LCPATDEVASELMGENGKSFLAEFVGTFTLVFIGAGAGALAAKSGIGLVGVALAHGVALLVIVYAWGGVSGAHVNPAVTFGVLLTGRMPLARALLYWGAQFLGAIVAAYLLLFLIDKEGDLGMTTGSLTGTDSTRAVVVEAVLTWFLVIAVFASGVGGRNGSAAGLAIGLVLTMDILMGGSLTGASMNPARSLGPAVAMGDFKHLWIYFAGPLIGGGLGGLLGNLFLPPVAAQSTTSRSRSST
jgi:MIP family channel proteins